MQYKDIVDSYVVYIHEAHAADDTWPVPYAVEKGIEEPQYYGERCSVAGRMVKDKKILIPVLVDGMDNKVAELYKAWPDRLFLIRKDGKLGVAAKLGPWGLMRAVGMAEKWLAEFRKTGEEPPLPKVLPKRLAQPKASPVPRRPLRGRGSTRP